MNSRFDSRLLHLFVLSLQSKETQKVHQHFRAVPASESKKSGSEAANRPHRSPIYPYLARFYPKMQEKTPFAVVDKRGFFDGRGRRTRTLKNGFGDRYVTITSCPYSVCKRYHTTAANKMQVFFMIRQPIKRHSPESRAERYFCRISSSSFTSRTGSWIGSLHSHA